MKAGVVFPTREIRSSADQVVEYARGAEQIGYTHLLAYDHVLAADPAEHPDWSKVTNEEPFHEPFTLFGFLAGVCDLELVSGVLVLPQRQTALVAKQAAQVDWLSGGRLRLGVGLGWNTLEYEALGARFDDRAERVVEQVDVLRRLWSAPSARVVGDHHSIPGVGLNPMPLQRPIPLWFGSGLSHRPIDRAAAIADGWMPLGRPGPEMTDAVERFRSSAAAAGRDVAALGLEARIDCSHQDLEQVVAETEYWRERGATHVSYSTMDAGFTQVHEHVTFLAAVFSATVEARA